MGREIRRVPINWNHPQHEVFDPFTGRMTTQYQRMYDRDAETAWAEWLAEFEEFKKEELARIVSEYPDDGYSLDEPYRSFCRWNGNPPDWESYHPKWPEGAEMGLAVYETVSEGTPVTPVFATKEELVDYLSTNGTHWDKGKPWPREAAERFVSAEWAPTFASHGARLITPSDPEMYDSPTAPAEPSAA